MTLDGTSFDGDALELVRSVCQALTDRVDETSCPGLSEWVQGDEFWALVIEEADAEYIASVVSFETQPDTETLARFRRAYTRLRVTWANARDAFDKYRGLPT